MPEPQTHVIVGGGLAGAKAAEALRTEGFEGRIVLLAEEPEAPYERPPLSKDYLRGESPREKARVHPEGFYADHDIELRTGTAVTGDRPDGERDRARRRRADALRPPAAGDRRAPAPSRRPRRRPRRRADAARPRRRRRAARAAAVGPRTGRRRSRLDRRRGRRLRAADRDARSRSSNARRSRSSTSSAARSAASTPTSTATTASSCSPAPG